jgi:uncharacterized RDD family membrane protein YckC
MMQAEAVRGTRAVRRAAPARRARVGLRLAAYVVDWLVTVIVASTLISVGGMQLWLATDRGTQDAPNASLYAFLVLAPLALPLWLLVTLAGWSYAGRSVGKLAMGLRIVDQRGRPPGLRRGAARLAVFLPENLALIAAPAAIALRLAAGDALPVWVVPLGVLLLLAALAALAPALVNRGGRALHDIAAGTVVVEE